MSGLIPEPVRVLRVELNSGPPRVLSEDDFPLPD
jgi:hypothetical protein